MPSDRLHLVNFCVVFIIWNALFTPNKAQFYNLIFSDFKCQVNNDFVANFSCFLNKAGKIPSTNMDVQMKKEVTDFRMDLFVYMEKANGESSLLFKVIGLQLCRIFEKNFSTPVLRAYKSMVLIPTNVIPKRCPIPANFHYKLYNITMDSELLPAYVPETSFKIIVVNKEIKEMFWQTTTLGKVVRRKSSKSRKNSNH
ncbi:uncharacterized protein LOC129943178 [Eupeodes corollae]|uniref:uncharacterized protein LOC129943178 n=1 Tax=Eupeodes corollae TaxID=290404 RepID=UPI002492D54C|nr:uncharacterized protein LOC129943178 [Eupeodes corollae]